MTLLIKLGNQLVNPRHIVSVDISSRHHGQTFVEVMLDDDRRAVYTVEGEQADLDGIREQIMWEIRKAWDEETTERNEMRAPFALGE